MCAVSDPETTPSPDATARVWRVRLGAEASIDDVEGSLSVDTTHLRFVETTGVHRHIELVAITRVKRLRGSPVILVDHDEPGGRATTCFYFVKPPPLVLPTRRGTESKRKARRAGVQYLGTANATRKAELREWVERIERARTGLGEEGTGGAGQD